MTEVIDEMIARGWNLSLIANRTGISQSRLERGVIGVREERELMRVASEEAGIEIDDLEIAE